ncbi:FAD-dependent oxidoreductase [Patescibacteria group bacterium]|nr:FAD-dependent oxidoreductase [Patescibacteria group bacterium]
MTGRLAIVLGAGITGLSSAYNLAEAGWKVIVLEKENYIGGLSTTFKKEGLKFDFGPHKLYTQDRVVEKEIKKLVDKDLLSHPKKSSIRFFGNYLDYPINFKSLLLKMSPGMVVGFGLSSLKAVVLSPITNKKIKNSRDYFISKFGMMPYKLIFGPLFKKVYGDPVILDPKLAETRLPFKSILDAIRLALFKKKSIPSLSAKKFYYPKNGVIQLSEKMKNIIENNGGEVVIGVKIEKIFIKEKKVNKIVYKKNNKSVEITRPEAVISTIPLVDLVSCMSPWNNNVNRSSRMLKYRSLVVVYLLLKRKRVFKESFVFFPEDKFVFQRLSEQNAFSKFMVPEGHSLLMAEVTLKNSSVLDERHLINNVIEDLIKIDIIKKTDVKKSFCLRYEKTYPIYDLKYRKNLKKVLDYIDKVNCLYSIGRQGLFLYTNIDHSIDMGMKLAKYLVSSKSKSSVAWKDISAEFLKYKIVD